MNSREAQGWIKICGMTSHAAVDAAVQAGVDAIGFVFAPSPRQVTPQQATGLARAARGFVACVAVTLHPDQQTLDAIIDGFAPDVLQTDIDDLSALEVPTLLPLLPVVRSAATAARFARLPQRLLFEGERSGVGLRSNWEEAATLSQRTRVVLAGGLHVGNVGAGVSTVRPFGVDTSSGVETAPGVKSPQLIAEFVTAARAAFDGISS